MACLRACQYPSTRVWELIALGQSFPGDNWLGKLALKLGTTDLDELLVGRWFIVNVETIKHRKRTHREVEEGIEIPDRPREEWYSTVRSVRLAEPEEF